MNDDPISRSSAEDDITLPSSLFDHPAGLEDLREQLRGRTLGVQKRRRIIRRTGRLGTLVLLYGLGILTARLLPDSTDAAEQVAEIRHHNESSPSEETVAGTEPWADDVQPIVVTEPEDLEAMARRGPSGLRQQRLREAGDLYLQQNSDVESALRCYRAFMQLVPESARTDPDPEDSWLLLSLKSSQTRRGP